MVVCIYVLECVFYWQFLEGGYIYMIIWINGAYAVGKTTVAKKIKESLSDDNIELLESDYYYIESLKRVVEKAEANKSFPNIGGTLPQNNMRFLREFRELIEEKSKNTDKNIIVDMALTKKECKEELFDHLKNDGIDILHIILTASEETIKLRIKSDDNRITALEWLTQNIAFLDRNFPDAIRIDTENRDKEDVANEVIRVIKL